MINKMLRAQFIKSINEINIAADYDKTILCYDL